MQEEASGDSLACSGDHGVVNSGCLQSPVYFLNNCDIDLVKDSLDMVIKHISTDLDKEEASSSRSAIVLSSKRVFTSLMTVSGYPQYFVSLCRENKLLKNDRVTLLSPMDQLIAIQLGLAEKNKQETGEFDVQTSIVLQASKDITNSKLLSHYDITSCTQESGICDMYQNFLSHCNSIDTCDVLSIVKEECDKNEAFRTSMMSRPVLILDQPKSSVDRKMVELLCSTRPVKTVTVEVPLDSENNPTVAIDNGCLETLLDAYPAMSTVKKPVSVTESYVRLVFLSYLELLVNSRSELAMSRVFNVPERELTHTAFTQIKHDAQCKNMTMYQTAVSFIMKIRLGGKGYAPDSGHPLSAHVKGIGEFVNLMHRMETVLEEDPDSRSACRRTVNIIKKEMLKCKDSCIRNSSVESVADNLQGQINTIIDDLNNQIVETPGKKAADGGSLMSRHARKVLRSLLDKLATVDEDMSSLDHLTDIYSSQRTPLRFPSVVSQFRSPEEELEVTSPDSRFNMSLSQRIMSKSSKKQTPLYAKRYKSSCDWAEPLHFVNLPKEQDIFSASQVYVIPSKTIVHAGLSFSSGEASKTLEGMMDKDDRSLDTTDGHLEITEGLADITNQCDTETVDIGSTSNNTDNNKDGKTKGLGKKKVSEKQSKKRPLQPESTQSSQPQKKKKAEPSKSCRRKLLPQVKGQQALTKFFRV